MKVRIDKDIPIPPREVMQGLSRNKYHHYPFAQMEVGDSIFSRMRKGIYSSARNYRFKHPEFQFTMRKEYAGSRLWRTA